MAANLRSVVLAHDASSNAFTLSWETLQPRVLTGRTRTPEMRPVWVGADGVERPRSPDWAEAAAAEGVGERDGWLVASIAASSRADVAGNVKDKVRAHVPMCSLLSFCTFVRQSVI